MSSTFFVIPSRDYLILGHLGGIPLPSSLDVDETNKNIRTVTNQTFK